MDYLHIYSPSLYGSLDVKCHISIVNSMGIEQVLQSEIHEDERRVDKAEGVYKRDLAKRVELINWVLDNMKNQELKICEIIESRINQTIDKINKTNSIFEADPLDSELRILDYLLYLVCRNEVKNIELLL